MLEIQCLCIFLLINMMTGHAFEARIYAENVPKGFLPAAGVLHHYRPVAVSQTGIWLKKNDICFFTNTIN